MVRDPSPAAAPPVGAREKPLPTRAAGEARAGVMVGLMAVAAILTIAGRSGPTATDARLGRRVQLVELIAAEQARVDALHQRLVQLQARVQAFEHQTGRRETLTALQAQVDALAAPAGFTPVAGPGVVATLADSSLRSSPTGNLNDLVIHEQDLQAVINALWAGGAEALAVNGQRILATSAIRCVGNTLLLHGAVYSPPYVVAAIGDQQSLHGALDRDPAVQRFREAAQRFGLGFSVADADLELPASPGTVALQSAVASGAVEG